MKRSLGPPLMYSSTAGRSSGTSVIGLYVGAATVGIFGVWYTHDEFMGIDLSGDKHSTITFEQLRNYEQCSLIHCSPT